MLWLYGDRHELTLAPPALALALVAISDFRFRAGPVIAVLLVWGTVAVIGTRDSWKFNLAVLEARQKLQTAYNAPEWEIDASQYAMRSAICKSRRANRRDTKAMMVAFPQRDKDDNLE